MMQRYLFLGVALVLVLAYPLLVAGSPVWQRLGALVLLAAIGASAWNIVGGYAGQVSVGHAVFFGFGAYSAVVRLHPSRLAADRRRADRHGAERR